MESGRTGSRGLVKIGTVTQVAGAGWGSGECLPGSQLQKRKKTEAREAGPVEELETDTSASMEHGPLGELFMCHLLEQQCPGCQ